MTNLVTIDHDRIVTDSRTLAQTFGKRHDSVLRAYDRLRCSEEFNLRNFVAVEYLDAKGERRRHVTMTKDGFVMLAMGIGAAYWMNYSMFTGWHIAVRNDTVGHLLTGFAFAGTTSVWRGLHHWLGASEGEEPEERKSHMRLAA